MGGGGKREGSQFYYEDHLLLKFGGEAHLA